MVVFLKPNSAITDQFMPFIKSHYTMKLNYVLSLPRQGKFTAVALGLDLTKRDLQAKLKAKGLPWERAKAFNGAAVFSDFVQLDTIDNNLSLDIRQ